MAAVFTHFLTHKHTECVNSLVARFARMFLCKFLMQFYSCLAAQQLYRVCLQIRTQEMEQRAQWSAPAGQPVAPSILFPVFKSEGGPGSMAHPPGELL